MLLQSVLLNLVQREASEFIHHLYTLHFETTQHKKYGAINREFSLSTRCKLIRSMQLQQEQQKVVSVSKLSK